MISLRTSARCVALTMVLVLGVLSQTGAMGKPAISGLQFPVGPAADKPLARVSIEEVAQGAQKRGFLRISILPLALAKGVEVRFIQAEPGALAELVDTLRSLLKTEAVELQQVRLFAPNDPIPRLTAAQAVPQADGWIFRKVRLLKSDGPVEAEEVRILWKGEQKNTFMAAASAAPVCSFDELFCARPEAKF